jgi:prophage regulatory protein
MQANTQQQQTTGETLLRLPAVESRTGLRKSAIYAGMKSGTFPPCLKLGARASAWPSSAIDAWIAERIASAPRKG